MRGEKVMKKQYQSPELELLVLKTNDFLNTSGDAVAADCFDATNYRFGEQF